MSELREVTRYKYTDANGDLLYWQVRYEPKTFRPMMPDGSLTLTTQRVLYRLPEVNAAIAGKAFILVVEGEKDVDRLVSEGFRATTAGSATSWMATDTTPLRKAWGVVAIPDNDEAGEHWLNTVATDLAPWVHSFQVLRLPDLSEHGDVSDWFDDGGTAADLRRLRGNAVRWKPPKPKPRPAMRGTGRGIGLPYSVGELGQVLEGFRHGYGDGASAFCPAHADTGSKGLSMTEMENGRTLVKCWSGCDFEDIAKAIESRMG